MQHLGGICLPQEAGAVACARTSRPNCARCEHERLGVLTSLSCAPAGAVAAAVPAARRRRRHSGRPRQAAGGLRRCGAMRPFLWRRSERAASGIRGGAAGRWRLPRRCSRRCGLFAAIWKRVVRETMGTEEAEALSAKAGIAKVRIPCAHPQTVSTGHVICLAAKRAQQERAPLERLQNTGSKLFAAAGAALFLDMRLPGSPVAPSSESLQGDVAAAWALLARSLAADAFRLRDDAGEATPAAVLLRLQMQACSVVTPPRPWLGCFARIPVFRCL